MNTKSDNFEKNFLLSISVKYKECTSKPFLFLYLSYYVKELISVYGSDQFGGALERGSAINSTYCPSRGPELGF